MKNVHWVLTFVEKTRQGVEREFERTLRADRYDEREVRRMAQTMHDSFSRNGRVMLPGFDLGRRAW